MTTRPRRPITIAVTTAAVIAAAVTAWVAARGDEATVEAGAASAENVARTTTTDAAPCPGLRSETAWTGSDDGSTLTAAAGSWAELSETVTNGPEPCELVSNRCGALARLLHPNGDRVETDDRACDLGATMLELDPHEVATFVDERPRWVSTDGFPGTDTDGRFGSMDLPSGRYASTVIVELADGSSVSSPLDLVVF